MKRITELRINQKLMLIIPLIGVILIAAVLFGTQPSGGKDPLSEAIEGGELTLTSVGRNYESLMQFVQDDELEARQLLEAARLALENAQIRMNSAGRTSDEYVLGMLDNYQRVAQASGVMTQGVDNLLVVNQNLTNALYYYSQEDFDKTAEQAQYCLQVLTPLVVGFEAANTTLSGINFVYIPSGQRDRLTLGVDQYRKEMQIYYEYILFLHNLLQGKEYLQMNQVLEEYLKQLQNATAKGDYQTAQELLQKISEILKSLKDQEYQSSADLASKLDPELLGEEASRVAQELRNKLRNLEGIQSFENYIQGLEKYLEALKHLGEGELTEAERAVNEGVGILSQGRGSDAELQGLYAGLREAFNTLQMRIRGQPPQG